MSTGVGIHDNRTCELGEGPLWHPLRGQLFWFDIIGKRLMTRDGDAPREWQFREHVSAAGWVDQETLLIASETALLRFDLTTGASEPLIALEADDPRTRSNDGRADPWGGFWIGTMGKKAEPKLGAIYRFYQGELRQLFAPITISNAICFAPDQSCAYFTDTLTQKVMRQTLDEEGWPIRDPDVLIDLRAGGLFPDGAVVDHEGCLWVAQWGASRVARYSSDGEFLSAISLPASQITCPSFGGPGLQTLFVTSAGHGVDEVQGGQTFIVDAPVRGQAEHQVIVN